jgi:hypothetical protein
MCSSDGCPEGETEADYICTNWCRHSHTMLVGTGLIYSVTSCVHRPNTDTERVLSRSLGLRLGLQYRELLQKGVQSSCLHYNTLTYQAHQFRSKMHNTALTIWSQLLSKHVFLSLMWCPAMTNMDRSKSPRTRATNCHFNSRLFRLFLLLRSLRQASWYAKWRRGFSSCRWFCSLLFEIMMRVTDHEAQASAHWHVTLNAQSLVCTRFQPDFFR